MQLYGNQPKRTRWYDKGFDEAIEGLPADPPTNPGHMAHENYMNGYRDGVKQLDYWDRKEIPQEDR